jgi:hypothetical protein
MKLALILGGAVLLILVLALVVLGTVDLPAPAGQVEKVIPADKLPH